MAKTRVPLRMTLANMPVVTGLVNAGPQALIPEPGLWEMDNAVLGPLNVIEKRRGLVQWGQTLKVPAVISSTRGLNYTEVFNDLSDFEIDDTAATLVEHELADSKLIIKSTAVGDGSDLINILRRAQSSDGTSDTSVQHTIRFMVRTAGALPAVSGADDFCPSVVIRHSNTNAYSFALGAAGIYWKASGGNYTLITDTDIDDSRWHIVEIRLAGANAVVLVDEDQKGSVESMYQYSATVQPDAYQFALRARTHATATYQIEFDFVQGRSYALTNVPFVGADVHQLMDWSSKSPIRKHILVSAGNIVYADRGHSGKFSAIEVMPNYTPPAFVPYLNGVAILHGNGLSKFWTGTDTPQTIEGIPPATMGAEHNGRLFVAGDSANPLRVYFSGAANLSDWTLGDSGSFRTSGWFDIADTIGGRVTAIAGNHYGNLIVWTTTSTWLVAGTFVDAVEDFSIGNISQKLGCVGSRAFDRVGTDLYFLSTQGLHSLATTQKFGDVEAGFLSTAISKRWDRDPYLGLPRILTNANSVVTHHPERDRTYISVQLEGDTGIAHILEFSRSGGAWAGPWGMTVKSMDNVRLSTPELSVIMVGDTSGRVALQENEGCNDFGSGYTFKITSSLLDGRSLDPILTSHIKLWKEIRVFIRPRGGPWYLKLDAYTEEDGAITQISETQNVYRRLRLDEFPLGVERLADSQVAGVITYKPDIRGRWMKFNLTQDGASEGVDILGFEVDFSSGKYLQEND